MHKNSIKEITHPYISFQFNSFTTQGWYLLEGIGSLKQYKYRKRFAKYLLADDGFSFQQRCPSKLRCLDQIQFHTTTTRVISATCRSNHLSPWGKTIQFHSIFLYLHFLPAESYGQLRIHMGKISSIPLRICKSAIFVYHLFIFLILKIKI